MMSEYNFTKAGVEKQYTIGETLLVCQGQKNDS